MKLGVFWIFLCVSQVCSAQETFKILRFEEDYRFLGNDSTKTQYDQMKFMPIKLGNDARYFSFGGEVRYQFQHFKNEDWGEVPVERYTAFYNRFLFHSDFHASPRFRVFTQLNSTFSIGRPTPNRSIDENRLDVQQLFFDVKPFVQADRQLTLRIGRQELLYGSQRIISVREGPNNRLNFDAAKLFYKQNHWQLDLYYARPVATRKMIFDDRLNQEEELWSLYVVKNGIPKLHNIDFYYIGYRHSSKSYNIGVQQEFRHSFGLRWWKNDSNFRYDMEALYQFGTFGALDIRAYTASFYASYQFEKIMSKPVIGIKSEIISGDNKINDEQLNTFNPLFPRGAYFGLAALVGPANLIDLHPSVDWQLAKNLIAVLDYDVFWRFSLQDGIYGPNGALIYGDEGSKERFIGHQIGWSAEWAVSKFLVVSPEMTYFRPGPYLAEVSPGKNVWFAALTAQFKF